MGINTDTYILLPGKMLIRKTFSVHLYRLPLSLHRFCLLLKVRKGEISVLIQPHLFRVTCTSHKKVIFLSDVQFISQPLQGQPV